MNSLLKSELQQLDLFAAVDPESLVQESQCNPIDLADYQRYIVAFSGGKDSCAVLLYLLDAGVDPSHITLHHHLVDGQHVDGVNGLMDWPITLDYCRKVASHFGTLFSCSWREGGFEREMDRRDSATAPVSIPVRKDGQRVLIGGEGKPNTRLKFPQVSANLSVRWCSSALKISAMDAWMRNDPLFLEGKTLVLTGERAEESTARSKYKDFEPHRTDNRHGQRIKRHVDHWRPVHKWSEAQVWEIMRRWKLTPHPAYYLGYSRCSCRPCIFSNKNQWATLQFIAPDQFQRLVKKEKETGLTIHRSNSIVELAAAGTPYQASNNQYWIDIGNSQIYTHTICTDEWVMPSGAYGESCGPS